MPFYIPWLTETIKKRGVRYLLHHYLGQFFEEKLTLEQLSIDIYEGKGSITDLSLDVEGLNDELDFIPFRFLDGCSIGQISVEVPWSSLATEACRVELDGAKFICRLKTSADAAKTYCTESTLLSRSLMTSSMQMAEEIVTTEDDDDYDSPESSIFRHNIESNPQESTGSSTTDPQDKRKNANQMFEGLEMFAQLIDSVLRRTKLTAHNTLFQIQPHKSSSTSENDDDERNAYADLNESKSSGDEFSEPIAGSNADSDADNMKAKTDAKRKNQSEKTVEFYIKFFRCEEIVDNMNPDDWHDGEHSSNQDTSHLIGAMPTTVTKLLTLEDVEMRIDGLPVSNLIGKHTITIKFNGQKSEISIFSGSPLLAVISHKQLETFFNVFDSAKEKDFELTGSNVDGDQKMMSPEDYAKIENQLLESASVGGTHQGPRNYSDNTSTISSVPYMSSHGMGNVGGRRWVESGSIGADNPSYANSSRASFSRARRDSSGGTIGFGNLENEPSLNDRVRLSSGSDPTPASKATSEPTLDNIEAFSCELKLPGIWLCILRDGEQLPPLIKPYADSINSFQSINKYIDKHINVPHIRCLALKVALDITATTGTNIFIGDLDISEYLSGDDIRASPIMLLHNDTSSKIPMNTPRYKASIKNGKDITIELLTSTRMLLDPTMIDRIVYDYKLIKFNNQNEFVDEMDTDNSECELESDSELEVNQIRRRASKRSLSNDALRLPSRQHPRRTSGSLASKSTLHRSNNALDLSLNIKGEQFKIELLCPIPDLTPEAQLKTTQLRPQSFIFAFKNILLSWQSDKLNVSSSELDAYVKTRPKQSDSEAVRFIESTGKGSDRITLVLEPSPSNLDNAFTSDIERALNESTLYDSIYVSQATESRIPTSPFQTKRKVVGVNTQTTNGNNEKQTNGDCDHEKILSPGDREHLLDYLNQTLMSTKLSLNIHLPICEAEFEDKEQLDLIYNRFGNDFVFWQPKAFQTGSQLISERNDGNKPQSFHRKRDSAASKNNFKSSRNRLDESDHLDSGSEDESDESEISYHSMNYQANLMARGSISPAGSQCYDNQVTCKILVDELYVTFNHQSCAAALKQEISADNLLMGIVIDVDNKPSTMLSLVADNLELSNDCVSTNVLEGNHFASKNSIFALTAEIKRPTRALKDIKLAIQLRDGLFNDFKTETYSRFWQSINVTDEPILGYQAPQILTELHVDILNTSLMLVKERARPTLISMDELYLTSMVMQQTSQVMIRLIADEVSLYMKRDKQGLEVMRNYVCLIDSGLIDFDIKFSQSGQVEFGVINNVITVRVCQDSLSALSKLFNVLIRSTSNQKHSVNVDYDMSEEVVNNGTVQYEASNDDEETNNGDQVLDRKQERRLLEDAMNDFSEYSSVKSHDDDDDDDGDDSDSDVPPTMQQVVADACDSGDDQAHIGLHNTCLLDESNPMLGDLFTQPLVPMNMSAENDEDLSVGDGQQSAMDESGFFVIGDDDVGAGIIDKNQQHEPVVRKLIDGPLNIIENHFKMTKPRTLPEMLVNSLERYVLDEMTLVINLFGGHDFDDQEGEQDEDEEEAVPDEAAEDELMIGGDIGRAGGGGGAAAAECATEGTTSAVARGEAPKIAANSGRLDESSSVESMRKHHNSLLDSAIRSRAGSMASSSATKLHQRQLQTQRNQAEPSGSESLRRRSCRKHLSESSGSSGGSSGSRAEKHSAEQRVRFGEGTVNLWESLDLMSSPDFLGATRPRPSQPLLSSDSKQAGGTWRQNDVCIQLILNKVKLLFEVADVTRARANGLSSKGLPLNGASEVGAHSDGPAAPISWRFMLFVQDIEVKDRIAASDINKMLYEYCTESMPKRSTQFLTIKNVATINQLDGCEECDLRVSLKPLRLNIDQDTLLFLIEFFTTFSKSFTKQQSVYSGGGGGSGTTTTTTTNVPNELPKEAPSNSTTVVMKQANVAGAAANGSSKEAKASSQTVKSNSNVKLIDVCAGQNEGGNLSGAARHGYKQLEGQRHAHHRSDSGTISSSSSSSASRRASSNLSTSSLSSSASTSSSSTTSSSSSGSSLSTTNDGEARPEEVAGVEHRQSCSMSSAAAAAASKVELGANTIKHHRAAGSGTNGQAIYIKSFTFSPDVPIRIDYHSKHLDFEQGALAGFLLGLAHLDHSELVLRRVHAKHGMRGLDRVLVFALNSWLSDIKRNQLPSILSGVGPMHSVIQLFQGMRDLIWMPIDHYRKDGRLVRGLQRGASSFSSSTAMAAINLVNRFISIVQCTAQIAHDIVTPPSASSLALAASGLAQANFSSRHHHQHRSKSATTKLGNSSGSGIGIGSGSGSQAVAQSSMPSASAAAAAKAPTTSMRRFHHNHKPNLASCSATNRLGGAGSAPHLVGRRRNRQLAHDRLNQPRNFCEGVAVGFSILKEGFNDTARNVTVGMQAEDMRSAVGELVRQIPSTLLNPIISATEGAQSVLVGIRNQIAPDARREDQEKWKGRVRGK